MSALSTFSQKKRCFPRVESTSNTLGFFCSICSKQRKGNPHVCQGKHPDHVQMCKKCSKRCWQIRKEMNKANPWPCKS